MLTYVPPATADLIGTLVTGSAGLGIINFFDPANPNQTVPAGFGNSAPNDHIDVPISASQIEFGFTSNGGVVTADFTENSLELKYVLPTNIGFFALTFTFTDTAFAGLSIVEISDNFPSGGVTAGLVGNVLTLNVPQSLGLGTFIADFSIAPAAVPGPILGAGLPGLILAGGILLALARHRHKSP